MCVCVWALCTPAEQLPVMEICFLLNVTDARENESIQFESVWGMPLKGVWHGCAALGHSCTPACACAARARARACEGGTAEEVHMLC